jgi:hypothetical protein
MCIFGQHTTTRVYLLSGIARCNHCGTYLVAQSSHNGPWYNVYCFCPSVRRAIDCPSQSTFAVQDTLDDQVALLISRLRLPENWKARLEEKLRTTAKRKTSKDARRKRLTAQMERLRDMYVDGDYTKSEYQERRLALEAQREDFKEDKPETPPEQAVLEVGEALSTLHKAWSDSPKEYRREMLNLIFEELWVDTIEQELISVVPTAEFEELVRLPGLEEREDGRFYIR